MNPGSRLKALGREDRAEWVLGIGLACGAALANFGLLFLSGWLLASAAVAGVGGIAARNAFNMFLPAAGVRFFATLRILGRYTERVVTHDASLRFIGRLRAWTFGRLVPLAPALLGQQRSGDVLFRFVADTDVLGQYTPEIVQPYACAAICGLVFVVIVALFSPLTALALAVALLIAGVIVPLVIGRLSDRSSISVAQNQDAMHGDMVEALQGMGELTFLGAADSIQRQLNIRQKLIRRERRKLAMLESGARCLISIVAGVMAVTALVFGAHAFQAGVLSAAGLPMLALGCLAAFDVVTPLPAARQLYSRVRIASGRIFALCDASPEVPAPDQSQMTDAQAPLDLVLSDVSLHYPQTNHWVLRHASLTIRQGEHVALVGVSGAGKSTLVNLLFRFYEYQEGNIHFGGADLRGFDADRMAAHISVVAQDFHLFQGSIRHNLLLACPAASEAQMWQALHTAQLSDFVHSEADALDTLIGEQGVRLSGGQARRLAVAQAILRQPSWVILDEPTEGLDATTEHHLMDALVAALPKATFLCITHRQAVIPFMSRMVRLHDGQFHEVGRPM